MRTHFVPGPVPRAGDAKSTRCGLYPPGCCGSSGWAACTQTRELCLAIAPIKAPVATKHPREDPEPVTSQSLQLTGGFLHVDFCHTVYLSRQGWGCGGNFRPHVTDDNTKAQTGETTCPHSQHKPVAELGLTLGDWLQIYPTERLSRVMGGQPGDIKPPSIS